MRIAWFSPFPPERSGIATYSAEILPLLSPAHRFDRIPELGAHDFVWQQRRQPYQLVTRKVLKDVDGDDGREPLRVALEAVKGITTFRLNAALPRPRGLFSRDVDASGVRESTPLEVRQQPARAAPNFEHWRRSLEVIQQRQVLVVPPGKRRLPHEVGLALEGRDIPPIQRCPKILTLHQQSRPSAAQHTDAA